MSRVRQKKTKAEEAAAAILREIGANYRRNVRSLPGSPDFANKRARWALFVNGCFWHHHRNCRRATIPANNREFWIEKFAANRRRDAAKIKALRSLGFHVRIVWECRVGDRAAYEGIVARAVSKASRPPFLGDAARALVPDIADELAYAGDRELAERGDKKNYAEALSRALAQRFANALRSPFPGILPKPDGSGQESRARTGKGMKKLDVNYSTVELGLGLGVSIKTLNFRDPKNRRYTKNFTRIDNELRAESGDYHQRQPYAVLTAVIFLPADACDDGGTAPSSFGQAVRVFRFRSGRMKPADDPTLFELVLIGLYEPDGRVGFFDVLDAPPRNGRPRAAMTFAEAVGRIVMAYDQRNRPRFQWADGSVEQDPAPTGNDVPED